MTVSETIVERTWQRFGAMSPAAGKRRVENAGKAQPALLAYVMATGEDSRPAVVETIVYQFLCLLTMFETAADKPLARVSIDRVEEVAETNNARFENLEFAHPRFLEVAARELLKTQPHVLQYIVEAIVDCEEDPDLRLSADESGLVFIVLRNVVQLLDEAMTSQPR